MNGKTTMETTKRNSLYPGTAYDEYRALLREYLGEAEAARIEAEEERKPLSEGVQAARQEMAFIREKARERAAKAAAHREAGDFCAPRPTGGGGRMECIDCLGDGGMAGPTARELVYEEVMQRHEAVVAANAGKEKHQATCVRVTWPDGRSIVFRSISDARAAMGIATGRESLRHNKRLRGFTVEFGMAQ